MSTDKNPIHCVHCGQPQPARGAAFERDDGWWCEACWVDDLARQHATVAVDYAAYTLEVLDRVQASMEPEPKPEAMEVSDAA